MIRVEKFISQNGHIEGLRFYCPGCKIDHAVYTKGEKSTWDWNWNGNEELPTISPSILVKFPFEDREITCHSFVRDGKIQYLSDCSHTLAGQTLELPNYSEIAE